VPVPKPTVTGTFEYFLMRHMPYRYDRRTRVHGTYIPTPHLMDNLHPT
jgi:hypothetical protein